MFNMLNFKCSYSKIKMLFLKGQLHPRVEFRENYIYFTQNVQVEYKNPFPYLEKK